MPRAGRALEPRDRRGDRRFDRRRLHGPRQVTDAYLLALAVVNDGRSATLDRTVPQSAVGARAEHRS